MVLVGIEVPSSAEMTLDNRRSCASWGDNVLTYKSH